MLDLLKYANLALAFALELAMLAAFANWALSLDLSVWPRIGIAVLAVGTAVAIWAVWAAPNSATRLSVAPRLVLEIALFALAAAGLWVSGRPGLGVALAVLVVLNFALAALWRQL